MAQDTLFAGRTGETAPVDPDPAGGTLGARRRSSAPPTAVLPGGLLLRCSPTDRAVVVQVEGEVDVHTSGELRAVLEDVITRSPRIAVVLDLTEMSFIDAAGIGVLVHALRRMRGTGGRLVLRNLRPPVLKVFRVLGLDRVFTIAP